MPTEAHITPELLTWARLRDRLNARAAAERLKVKPERLAAWEAGEERPTFRQAEKAAERLNIPFGYLFLSSPPDERFPLPDLRTVGDQARTDQSPELRDVVYAAIEKQDWYREYLLAEGATELPFIGRYTVAGADVATIAADIRATVGMDSAFRRSARNWEHFLTLFIERVERAGVLVLRSGIVGMNTHRVLQPSEFRGFAIIDPIAPLVFLNAADARSAQIFTLAHEVAHLWLGESGVSNPDYARATGREPNEVERLCSRIAAEVLLPKEDFLTVWDARLSDEKNIDAATRYFRVSGVAALRQAYALKQITAKRYSEVYRLLASRRAKKVDSGGNYYSAVLSRNSPALTTAVFGALHEGRVTYRDASKLLGVRVPMMDRVSQVVAHL